MCDGRALLQDKIYKAHKVDQFMMMLGVNFFRRGHNAQHLHHENPRKLRHHAQILCAQLEFHHALAAVDG